MSNNDRESQIYKSGIWVTCLGLLLFVITTGSVIQTGKTINTARDLVSGAANDLEESLKNRVIKRCVSSKGSSTIGKLCDKGKLAYVNNDPEGELYFTSCISRVTEPGAKPLSTGCSEVWREALRLVDVKPAISVEGIDFWIDKFKQALLGVVTYFSYNGVSLASTKQVSLVNFYLLTIIALLVFLMGTGRTVTQKWLGLLLNQQHRVSLSRFQIVAWTIVLLSAFAVYSSFNIGVMGSTWLLKEATRLPGETLFPQLPTWSWALLGITVSSPLASALIKGWKPDDINTHTQIQSETHEKPKFWLAPLHSNSTKDEAAISDMVLGEDTNNAHHPDLTRAQLLILTMILITTYAGWLVISLGGLSTHQILSKFPDAGAVLSSIPEPGSVFVALLTLTHAVYLAGKWQPISRLEIVGNGKDSL